MQPEICFKIEYLLGRENPGDIFKAMSLYIEAYQDLAKLISLSLGNDREFKFQLNSIEQGSIISRLSAIKNSIGDRLEQAIYSSGDKLFKELSDVREISKETEVNAIACNVEEHLAIELQDQIADPYLNRKKLALVLSGFSAANSMLNPDEKLEVSYNGSNGKATNVNIDWVFTGNISQMFKGGFEEIIIKDVLTANATVNKGDSLWEFYSYKLKKKFQARVLDKDWLTKYQEGMVRPIGAKDLIDATITYSIHTSLNNNRVQSIRNVRVLKVHEVRRDSGYQYEL